MALKLNSDEEIRSSTEYERTLLLQNKLSPASAGGQAGVAASVFNLVNTVVGGGVLSLPYAFSTSGIVLGVFFLYFVVALSIMSLLLLVDGARLSGLFHLATFREMSRKAFGNKGVYLSDFFLVLACFGALCSYLVIIADMLSPLIVYFKDLPSEGLATINRDLIIGILICILFPIACVRYLSIYKYISFGAVVAIAYFVVIVIYQVYAPIAARSHAMCTNTWRVVASCSRRTTRTCAASISARRRKAASTTLAATFSRRSVRPLAVDRFKGAN